MVIFRIDNLVFRKIPVNQAIGRARKAVAEAEKKGRSPLKKNEPAPAGPGPPPSASSESESSKTTVDVKTEVKQEIDEGNVEQQNNNTVSQISNISTNNVLPLLQGPVTEYSRRMYKRIYGVCPLQTESNISIDSESDANVNTEVKSVKENTYPKLTSADNKTNQNETKSPGIATQLQEQVKEFIKLGSNSISKSSLRKSPPKNMTGISPGLVKIDSSTKHTKNESASTQQLVIYCDGKDGNSQEKWRSNIDMNETISNILTNQRNGLYTSSNKSIEVSSKFTKSPTLQGDGLNNKDKTISSKKSTASLNNVHTDIKVDNLNLVADRELSDLESKNKKQLHDSNKSKQNRLMANLNKRVLSKSVISPVTFGKLVSPEISKSQTSSNTPENKSSKGETSNKKDSADIELNEVTSLVESKNNFETNSLHLQSGKKKHFLTELFGESPLKSSEVVQVTVKEQFKVDNRSSLPQNVTAHPDPSVFPNSPDSDNPEDLVIDSTACSRNTSPRVSESCEKDGDNIEHTSNVPIEKLPLKCAVKKQSECSKIISLETTLGAITKSNSLNEILLLPKPIEPSNKFVVNGQSDVSVSLAANDTLKASQKDNPCLPDLSECFSLEGKSQIETEPKHSLAQVVEKDENDVSKLAAGSQSVSLPNEDNTEFCGYLSHSSSSEVNSVNNTLTCKTGEIPISNVKRFIPSPSQLSLVSALRHSESSVFNIAEDTAGFVSALTRVRDISPIRTPDKNKNQSTSSDSQLKTSEVNDGGQEIGNDLALVCPGKIKSIPFASFQNSRPIEINLPDAKESAKSLTQSIDCQSSNLTKSQCNNVQGNFFDKLKNTEFTCNESKSSKFTNFKSSSIGEKPSDHDISNVNEPSQSSTSNIVTTNIFKRSRPVRRIVLPNQTTRESSEKLNKESGRNTQSSDYFVTTETKLPVGGHNLAKESDQDHDVGQNIGLSYVEENKLEKNINSFKPAIFKTGDTNQTKVVPNDMKVAPIKSCNDNNMDNINFLEVSSSSKKCIITSPSNCEKKTFKRSVSLKTMPKPLPKINYDILNRHENEEDKCLKQKHAINNELFSNQKDGSDKQFKNKKQRIALKPRSVDGDKAIVSPTLKSDINYKHYNKPTLLIECLSVYKQNIEETLANRELEQSPHIANINKRTRVSSFQRKQNSVTLVKDSKDIIKNMGKPCQKETNIIKNLTQPVSGNSSTLSRKVSREVSSKLEYPIKSKNILKTSTKLKRNCPMIKMSKGSEQEICEVSIQSCHIKEKESKPTSKSISFSQPCKSQSKSPSPHNKCKFETSSGGFDEVQHQRITQRKLTRRENNNKPIKSIENPQTKVLKTKNTGMDSTNDLVRSLSNSSEENVDHIRRSHSSSPEVRSRSKYVKKQDRTESMSPQPSARSKSCLQTKRLQSISPETRERSKSQHLKRSQDDSPDLKSDKIHHKSLYIQSPNPNLRDYYVQRRSRSRSRELDYRNPRKSERSSRSRHKSSYSRHSPKHYVERSRSRSSHSYDRYKRRICQNKNQYYKQSSSKSPYLTRKRKSRSLSQESLNHRNELKRSRQTKGNSPLQQQHQTPNRIVVCDRKETPQKRKNPAGSQESLIRLENLEKKFSFLTNEVHKKFSQSNNQLSQKPKTSSFLDEIEEIKKEMINLKSQFKKVKSPSEDNEIVPSAKIHLPENTLGRVSLTHKVPQPSVNKADKLSISKRTDDSSCLLQLQDLKTKQEVSKNDLAALPNTVSVQTKLIPVIKYVKRRSTNLGDSDVTVVSSSTSKPATVTSRPEVIKDS